MFITFIGRSTSSFQRGFSTVSKKTSKKTPDSNSLYDLLKGTGIAVGVLGTFGICVNVLDMIQ